MTREEAIKGLKALAKDFSGYKPNEEMFGMAIKALEQPEIIRCKDCKHRPTATRAEEKIYWGFSVEFPDQVCPLQCEDGWYSHYPNDDFYCGNAEMRGDPT